MKLVLESERILILPETAADDLYLRQFLRRLTVDEMGPVYWNDQVNHATVLEGASLGAEEHPREHLVIQGVGLRR